MGRALHIKPGWLTTGLELIGADGRVVWKHELRHDPKSLLAFNKIIEQLDMRRTLIQLAAARLGFAPALGDRIGVPSSGVAGPEHPLALAPLLAEFFSGLWKLPSFLIEDEAAKIADKREFTDEPRPRALAALYGSAVPGNGVAGAAAFLDEEFSAALFEGDALLASAHEDAFALVSPAGLRAEAGPEIFTPEYWASPEREFLRERAALKVAMFLASFGPAAGRLPEAFALTGRLAKTIEPHLSRRLKFLGRPLRLA